MAMFSMLKKLTNGYSPLESLIYDRVADTIGRPLHDLAMSRIATMVGPDARILDVGCGGGQFALALADRFPDASVVGLDLSPEQIARARSRGSQLRDRVSFVEGTALDLPFAEAEFDLVYSLGSIKHWPDRERGLRECARVLAPGGRLWVLEGDRGCRPDDVRALVSTWGLPPPLQPLAALFFRNAVVGESLDLDEARGLLTAVATIEGSVERGQELPVWVIAGRRAGGSSVTPSVA